MKLYTNLISKATGLVNSEHKPLLTNFFSLGIIQGSNFLLAIVTFPYIVRVIGVENFGLVTLLQTIMLYFTVLTDYGFNLSATKDISINRNNKEVVSRIFSEVIITKVMLLIATFLLLSSFLFLIPGFRVYWPLTLLSFPIVVGQVLQPTWFFQGIEKMKYITYINILIRGLYAIGVFIFIQQAQDYLYINLLNGISLIMGGAISLFIVFRKFHLRFNLPNLLQIKNQLVYSWHIFFSTLSVSISNNTNILILGLFASPLVLGYYSIAEKTFQIMRTFAVILYQVVYPRVCMLAQESFFELASFLRKINKIVLLSFLPMSVAVFVFADFIVYIIAGEALQEASLVLRIICFGPFMAALNIAPAQTMLAYQFTKSYTIIVSIGAAVNITLNLVLAYYFKATGTALSIIFTETLITVCLYLTLYKMYPHYFFYLKSHNIEKAQV